MRQYYSQTFFYLGERVRLARVRLGLSQLDLAQRLGHKTRKKVVEIENFTRELDYAEVEELGKVLKKPYWYFTDPYQLVCTEKFRYRTTAQLSKRELANFEKSMRQYVGNYRFLLNYFQRKEKSQAPKFDLRLPFVVNSPAEFAVNAGERMADILKLGTKPIDKLQSALAEKLGIMTLMLDVDNYKIAGASLNLPEAGFICINRHLPKNKRSFAIAHELFHLLTWYSLPYDRTSRAKQKLQKVEELADIFASSLLMPRQKVEQLVTVGKQQVATHWVVETVADLGVSALALQERIKQIGDQSGKDLSAVFKQLKLDKLATSSKDNEPAPPFAKRYLELITKGVEEPLMSTVAGVHKLGCDNFEAAGEIFATYGVRPPDTLAGALPNLRKR